MFYTKKYIISPHDCDKDKIIKLDRLCSKMSITEFHQVKSDAFYKEYLEIENLFVVLTYRYFKIYELPKINTEITVSTGVYYINQIIGYRTTSIRDTAGKLLVMSYVEGVFVDIENHFLRRVSKDALKKAILYPCQDIELPLKPNIDNLSFEYVGKRKVLSSYVDEFNHMNNAKYLAVTNKYVKTNVKEVSIVYKKEALVDDILKIYKYQDSKEIVIKIENINKDILCILRYII
ncbi:MAG: hypothetical protein LBV51_03675 [Acholeplasmatales bacterium]|jgi:acyl-ACP thioesterase|nr:hypothetical protein [Acholeplasmatales bacterium]